MNYIEIAGKGTRYYGERLEDIIYCIETNENEEHYRYKRQAIKTHSFNKIDLVEVGDYVNGHKVTAVYLDGATKYIKLDNAYENGEGTRTYEEDIKTLVTKEQYKSIEYAF